MCFRLSDASQLDSPQSLMALEVEYESALAQRPNMPPRERSEYVRALGAINHRLSLQNERGPSFEPQAPKPGGITYGAIDANGFPAAHFIPKRIPLAVEIGDTGAP